MGSGGFVGVEGVARKIKSIYIGVNGVAQEVKNAYVGVEGVAELIYSGKQSGFLVLSKNSFQTFAGGSDSINIISSSGNVTASTTDQQISVSVSGNTITIRSLGETTGNYSVSVHVAESEEYSSYTVNISVVITSKPQITLSGKGGKFASAVTDEYAFFAPGDRRGYWYKYVDAIDSLFTVHTIDIIYQMMKSWTVNLDKNIVVAYGQQKGATGAATINNGLTVTSFSTPDTRWGVHGVTVGDYGIAAGGLNISPSYENTFLSAVFAVNKNLTFIPVSDLSSPRELCIAISNGLYAIIAGGRNNNSSFKTVEAYDSSLSKITASDLTIVRDGSWLNEGTTVGNYSLICGNPYDESFTNDTIDVYDSSLTKQVPLSMPEAYQRSGGVTNNDEYAIFSYGKINGSNLTCNYLGVVTFDTSLTRQVRQNIPNARFHMGAATFKGNTFWCGGYQKVVLNLYNNYKWDDDESGVNTIDIISY